MIHEYLEDTPPAETGCSSKLHEDAYARNAAERVRLLSQSQTFAALGSADKDLSEAAQQRLQRLNIKYEPSDLIERAIKYPGEAEDVVKGLSGLYGISQTMAWAAVSLGSGDWKTRERATGYLKDAGPSGFKTLRFALSSGDAEVSSRAEGLRDFFFQNLPPEELSQHRMFLGCLREPSITSRFNGQTSLEELKVLEKETHLLRAFPDSQKNTVEELRQELASQGSHNNDLVRELDARTNLGHHLQRIDIAIANRLQNPSDKFRYLMKALEAYPDSKNEEPFLYELRQNGMLEDPTYRRAFARAGVVEAADPPTP